ncbi:2'-deoxymugineic-acid 2'-dioxygenase [Spinacia oleracea]|uniref:2'-deoxymugineic-acid 2'-dioxygenase n=1 Tax=Spinacia oleracea TaxID=3562 RepID=A0A9R0IFQ1_SPIOL|nr:2'-deoxymugineic-acid 2'-dioxygenase-like [Spinacia oleracea]
MEKFVSSWSDGKTLPESYVFPAGQRPAEHLYPKSKISVPLIDLGKENGPNRLEVVQQIMEAAQTLGAFQVINHGISTKLMDDTLVMFKEFFNLPVEKKAKYCSWDTKEKFILYTSNFGYDEEKLHFWRDAVTQRCAPLEECTPYWPDEPAKYREIVGEYTAKAKEVGLKILELIAEGLGLEVGYFDSDVTQEVEMNVNHYPACPDPTLTLGAGLHSDRSLITILMQGDVSGLQFNKDGEWIAVDPIPDVLCVNIGYLMQIVSNGKLKSGDHRAVTNAEVTRESAALFLTPTQECLIEPAKALINGENPQLFRAIHYHEFLTAHNAVRKAKLSPNQVLKSFLIKP